jgi:hypothetical protein
VPPGVTPSHGGLLLPLPNQKGFVEILVESDKTSKSQGHIVAYFVNGDGSAATDPAPTNVSFKSDDGKTVPLAAESKPDASSKGAKFASAPGTYLPGRALAGSLTASLGGESVDLPVLMR